VHCYTAFKLKAFTLQLATLSIDEAKQPRANKATVKVTSCQFLKCDRRPASQVSSFVIVNLSQPLPNEALSLRRTGVQEAKKARCAPTATPSKDTIDRCSVRQNESIPP